MLGAYGDARYGDPPSSGDAQAGPTELAPAPARLLQPGRNCWRLARAPRLAFLIDGKAYFDALAAALAMARRRIVIVGWDFDARIELRPGQSPPLGVLLRELVEARPDLEILVLVWGMAPFYGPGATLPLLFGAAWHRHPRIRVRLDFTQRLDAAHHQKLVAIDAGLAFVGGMDLTVMRWDTPAHAHRDPGRRYPPVHDVQALVDGDAAAALADVARQRWEAATGEILGETRASGDAWPQPCGVDLRNVAVGVTRAGPLLTELPCLTFDLIRAARTALYIETQYFASEAVADALAERIAAPSGPEVALVANLRSRGLLEHFWMAGNRDRLLRRLARDDRNGRLAAWWPAEGGKPIELHSKIMIVDDRVVRLGSANLNNRSLGFDTECDIAVEATDDESRAAVAGLRHRLLAEHLGSDPETVGATIRTHGLLSAVDLLKGGARALRAHPASSSTGPTQPLIATGLFDPLSRRTRSLLERDRIRPGRAGHGETTQKV